MATFLEIWTIADNLEFQSRVRAAAVKVATAVSGEAIGTFTEAQSIKRQTLANSVLKGGENWFNWSIAVANNPTVQANGTAAPDNDIEFTVTSLWDDMAGVSTIDLQ